MDILIENIKGLIKLDSAPENPLVGDALGSLDILQESYLCINQGLIQNYGPMDQLPELSAKNTLDAQGCYVLPSFVDSHSHIVYAGSREREFVDKIKGLSYSEIARKGGGILNSAARLQKTSEEELYQQALLRVNEVISMGTGALEIKSGYGLTLKDEIKMLQVARRLQDSTPITIKTTFLGAHAFPKDKTRTYYIEEIINEMIPEIARLGLADYCDVFCEQGFFTPEESTKILNAGLHHGLKPKVHANQLHLSGGVQTGVSVGAVSVDHLECIGEEEISCLQKSTTMPTLLPGAAFFLNLNYPPARKLIQASLPVTLASDFNPGSAPSGNMGLILSLACIQMKMTPEEAINAATVNGAFAMGLNETLGSISVGKVANVMITKPISSPHFIPYAFGSNMVDTTILNGQVV